MVYVLPCLLFLLIPLHAMSTTPLSDWSMSGANTCLVGTLKNMTGMKLVVLMQVTLIVLTLLHWLRLCNPLLCLLCAAALH